MHTYIIYPTGCFSGEFWSRSISLWHRTLPSPSWKFLMSISNQYPHLERETLIIFTLVLPILACHINGIRQYVLFCVELPSLRIMSMVLFWSVVCSLFIAEWYSIVWIVHNLCIHSLADGHLGHFQFLATVNKTVMNILVQVFLFLLHCTTANTWYGWSL